MLLRRQIKAAFVLSFVLAVAGLPSGVFGQGFGGDLPSLPTIRGTNNPAKPIYVPAKPAIPTIMPRPSGPVKPPPTIPWGNRPIPNANPAADWGKFLGAIDGIKKLNNHGNWIQQNQFPTRQPNPNGYWHPPVPQYPSYPSQSYGPPSNTQPVRRRAEPFVVPNVVTSPVRVSSSIVPRNSTPTPGRHAASAPAAVPSNSVPANSVASNAATKPAPSNSVPANHLTTKTEKSVIEKTDRGDTYQFTDDPEGGEKQDTHDDLAKENASRQQQQQQQQAKKDSPAPADSPALGPNSPSPVDSPTSRPKEGKLRNGDDKKSDSPTGTEPVAPTTQPMPSVGGNEQRDAAKELIGNFDSTLLEWGSTNLSEQDQRRLKDALAAAAKGETEDLYNLMEDLKDAGRLTGDNEKIGDYLDAAVAAGKVVEAIDGAQSLDEIGRKIEQAEDAIAQLPDGKLRDQLQDKVNQIQEIQEVREQAEEVGQALTDLIAAGVAAGIPTDSMGLGGAGSPFDPNLFPGAVDPSLAGGAYADPGCSGGSYVDPAMSAGGYVDPSVAGSGYADPAASGVATADPSGVGGQVPVDDPAAMTIAPVNTPVAEATGSTTDSGLLIINPSETGSQVGFLIDEQSCELAADSRQAFKLSGSDHVTITFDRGTGGESARYTLKAGTYKFKVVEKGWELVSVKFKATIENRGLGMDFNYLVDGETTTLKDGETVTHRSDYPIEVRFDKGDGAQPAVKRLDSGSYKLGVEESSNTLNLFQVHQDQVAQH